MDSNNSQSLREAVIEEIQSVYDPEIPVNIFELGLVYEVKVEDDKVHVLMTLTSPNCPVAESLPMEVKQKIEALHGVSEAEVEITFDPPWDEDMMSDEARLELGLL
ncbi:MAG: SUF system Fe-S cluster assembly protein [Bacteroidales bacterium]|jgi:FeS assembly SUF system protein|nr:SUF system Fe-S cluster assembly protein [Bacteroidales bacterium]NCU36970.1 SUF system Fe-S cluster assembly protein [Candidatus Falkowbacteria bacterium]MDD2631391.1 SUF system Fe-S cluster assembly protein [Bacteroidales bacterium]MDD3132522.1 SUF system Fe-S cluster assembly protein [Bacteroidales bacterium]MDD3525481.1 SUF system Fe-S cluster assembly protein [Bacteroidales bacterium]